MRNIALILSYWGAPFFGWQKTAAGPTVEEALEQALERILRHPVKLQAASRTDAGVHAQGQVVNFFTDNPMELPLLQRALNGTLPKTIGVVRIEEKPELFHPTLHAQRKEYHYHMCTGQVQLPFYRHTSWHFHRSLDLNAMQQGAAALLGTHDFSSFCNARAAWDKDPICTLETLAIAPLEADRFHFRIVGDHFLYKMVRNLIGTLAYVGCRLLSAQDIPTILASKQRARAGITAPSHGLCLHEVYYALA